MDAIFSISASCFFGQLGIVGDDPFFFGREGNLLSCFFVCVFEIAVDKCIDRTLAAIDEFSFFVSDFCPSLIQERPGLFFSGKHLHGFRKEIAVPGGEGIVNVGGAVQSFVRYSDGPACDVVLFLEGSDDLPQNRLFGLVSRIETHADGDAV